MCTYMQERCDVNDKTLDLLQQIAIDVAVIKNRLDNFEDIQEKVEIHSEELASVKSQLSVTKWIGGVLGAGVLGVVVKAFTGNS